MWVTTAVIGAFPFPKVVASAATTTWPLGHLRASLSTHKKFKEDGATEINTDLEQVRYR